MIDPVRLPSGSVLAAVALLLPGFTQAQVPGGVGGVAHWFRFTCQGADTVLFLHTASGPTEILGTGIVSFAQAALNFNVLMPCPEDFTQDIDTADVSKLTVFTAYGGYPGDQERVVWSLEAQDSAALLLTDRRLARLADTSFVNFPGPPPGRTRINTYQHNFDGMPQGAYKLRLGGASHYPDFSLFGTIDTIAEVLIYDRVISSQQRTKVQSYLAMKYGTTLLGSPYLDAAGTKVWDDATNSSYGSNIIAIGRDDLSGLRQVQSTSANEEGFLVIGVEDIAAWNHLNPTSMPDEHFVVAGDNGSMRTWAQREPGQPQWLEREWLVQRTGDTLLSTAVHIDKRMIQNQPETDQNHWLVIDRSGTGEFGPEQTEYILGDSISDDGIIKFEQVIWDYDDSGKDIFRLASGGSFISKLWVTQPTCDPEALGTLHIGVEGGEPEFNIRLKQVDGAFEQMLSVTDHDVHEIPGIAQGEYNLEMSDATGYVLSDVIWVQATDAPVSPLMDEYVVSADSPLILDAGEHGTDVTYEWECEGEIAGQERTFPVERTGNYRSTIIASGCISKHDFRVRTEAQPGQLTMALLPNPSMDGYFNVRIALAEVSDVWIRITDVRGITVLTKELTGMDFYSEQFHLAEPGMYMVTIATADGQSSMKLIVM